MLNATEAGTILLVALATTSFGILVIWLSLATYLGKLPFRNR